MSDAQDNWQRLAMMVVELSDTMHDPHDVKTDTRLVGDLGLSSLMAVNLMVDLETAFDIVVREEDFDHLVTVGDLLGVIERRQMEKVP
jgi:acyl carrier protein